MQKVLQGLFVKLFVVMLLTSTSSIGIAQKADKLKEKLDEQFATLVTKYNLKGVATSISFSDGSVWNAARGKHGNTGNDISADMLFEMGSNTKTFTAAIIIQLIKEEKLALDHTIKMYLDSFPNVDGNVTIRQLLNHTSGIYSYTNNPDFNDAILSNSSTVWDPTDMLKEFVKTPSFKAGTKWEYSNSNYVLLGLIIEKIEKTSYHTALRNRLLKPLGLDHSYLDIFEGYNGETRTGTWIGTDYFNEPFPAFMSAAWAAGGLVCPPEDLVKWARKLYTEEVLGKDWTDSMKTEGKVKGKNTGYGLGMVHRTYRGHELFGHGGTTLQHSTMEYTPDGDFALVTVINEQTNGAVSGTLHDAMLTFTWDALVKLSTDELPTEPVFQLFPNPANGWLNVLSTLDAPTSLTIRDLEGRLLFSSNFFGNTNLDISKLSAGLYLAEIQTSAGDVHQIIKLVVQ